MNESAQVVVKHTFCALFNPKDTTLPIKDHLLLEDFHQAVYPSESPESRTGCSYPMASSEPLQGSALILDRGNCSFYRKALTAQSADAAMLVVVYDSNQLPHFPHLFLSQKKPTDFPITIPVLYVLHDSGQQLKVRTDEQIDGLIWEFKNYNIKWTTMTKV